MVNTREQIIASTCDLMENLGYHATGLSQIVKESGAPKGSIYYYFPEGKEEIAAEAIQRAARQVAERISANVPDGEGARAGIVEFMRNIAYFVEQSGFQSGGPLTTVAMETATTSERLNLACRAAYAQIQSAFQTKLEQAGYAPEQARSLAQFVTSSIEGGIILSRTEHSGDPLRNAAVQIERLLSI